MSRMALRQLVGAALVDRELCEGLMNGQRSTLLAGFDLTDEERDVVASLETESLRDLVSVVHDWLKKDGDPVPHRLEYNAVQVV